jgi:hypothetical protein
LAKFEKLRVSLASDPHTELFGDQAVGPARSRREFLEAVFGESRTFLGRGSEQVIGFEPIPAPAGYVAGFFKRERPISARRRDLAAYTAENFELALVVMSVEKDQIAWVQQNHRVASPRSLLEHMFSYLAEKTDLREWRANVRFMDSKGEYFEVLAKRSREVAVAKFTFLPPNALGGDDRVREFVRIVDKQGHPQSQTHVYKGPPGTMDLNSEMMEASARVAMEGGGDAELRNRNNKLIYHSAGARTEEDIPNEDLPTPENPGFIRRVIMRLFEQRP